MSVALIHIPFVSDLHTPPLAPALLKSCLAQKNIVSKVFDFNLKFQLEFDSKHKDALLAWMISPEIKLDIESYNLYMSFVRACSDEVIAYGSNAVGVSVFSHNSHRFAEDICFDLKSKKNLYITLGGSGVQTLQSQYNKKWGELMIDSSLADCVVYGEGELVIANVFIEQTKGIVISKQLDSEFLQDLPVPNFDDYSLDLYGVRSQLMLPITSSKGCVRSCSFCDVASIWPKYRYRRGENVANEIISIYQKYNIKNFAFTDSLINGGLKPFREMNEILAAQIPDCINYNGQFICRDEKSMPPRDFKLMKRGGCRSVSIGIESGSENVRLHMKKGFSNQDIDYTAHQLIDNGIVQKWNIIVGYPTETDSDWNDTLTLIKRFKNYHDMIKITPVGVFQLLQNIPLREKSILNSLELSSQTTHGYDEYNWISYINPTNTFKERVNRWRYLIEMLKEFNMLNPTANIDQKNAILEQQLNYYESKSNKTTIPIVPYSLQSSRDFGHE